MKQNLHIALVTDAWLPQTNGVVRTLLKTQQVAEDMGHNITFITPHSFKTIPCPTYPEIRLSLFPGRKFKRLLKSTRPDAVHIATEGPLGIAARMFCRKHCIPFTTAYHTKFPEYVHARIRMPLKLTFAWLRFFHNGGKGVMVPTKSLIEELDSRGFTNTRFWSRGVDLELFQPTPDDRLYENLPRPIMVCHGRVAVEKNLDAFLKLDMPGTKVIIGDGPQRNQLEKKYPNAIFKGYLPDEEMVRHISSADVMVFPSVTETYGHVVTEALACNTPVAAFPVTGPGDTIGSATQPVGALNLDLKQAVEEALKIDRSNCRPHAETYTWQSATTDFINNLAPFNIDDFPALQS